VCQVLSQNIDMKCLKSGGQKHPKGPLLGMPALRILQCFFQQKSQTIKCKNHLMLEKFFAFIGVLMYCLLQAKLNICATCKIVQVTTCKMLNWRNLRAFIENSFSKLLNIERLFHIYESM
jgi:hypothetical protein